MFGEGFVPAIGGGSLWGYPAHGLNGTIAAAGTMYVPFYYYGLNAVAYNALAPGGGPTFKMTISLNSAQPNNGSLVCTLMVENIASSLVLTLAASTGAGIYSVSSPQIIIAEGNRLVIRLVNNSATLASAQIGACGLSQGLS